MEAGRYGLLPSSFDRAGLSFWPVPSSNSFAASISAAPAASRIAGLTDPPVFSSKASAWCFVAAGDRRDDPRGAALELQIVGMKVDHVAVMHMAEMDGGECRQHVERDLLRRSSAHARRAGDQFRRRLEQDRRLGQSEQRRAFIVGDGDGLCAAARGFLQRADRIRRRAAGRHRDQAVACADAGIGDVPGPLR